MKQTLMDLWESILFHFWFAKEAVVQAVKQYWGMVAFYSTVAVLVLALVASISNGFTSNPEATKPTPITQSSKVTKVDTEVINPEAVRVYKPVAKKKLNLPAQVQADEAKVVTSAVTVDYSLRPQTVTSVLDTATGETTSYVNEEPYLWLSTRSFGSASLAYGIKGFNPAPVVRLSVTQDVLQIKALTFGGVATLDSDGDTFVGLRGTYRW